MPLRVGASIPLFKERLIAAGASESVFEAVNRQLAKHGFIARGGQIIYASFVQSTQAING
jgi:hypothetical protein